MELWFAWTAFKVGNPSRKNHLCWRTRIRPQFVHVHTANRDGFGLSANDVHSLCSDISECGWEWNQVRAICAELSPAEIPAVEAFNRQLVGDDTVSANLRLAPVVEGTVKYASLSASHTNQVLRLFAANCLHEGDPDLLVQGRLSIHQLQAKDPAFADAVEQGLWWCVVSQEVMSEYPQLASMMQQANNTGAQLQRKEPELQLCRRLLAVWQQESKSKPGKQIQYQDVKVKILRTKPTCAPAVPHMWAFMMKFGGGAQGQEMRSTEEFVKGAGASQRSLGAEVWDSLSLPGKGGELLLRARHAALRLAYVDEKPLTANEIKRMLKANDVVTAEKLMHEVRDLAAGLTPELHHEVLLFEHQLIVQMLDRKGRLPSMQHAAQALVAKIQEKGGPTLTEKWNGFTLAKPAAAGPSVPVAGDSIAKLCCTKQLLCQTSRFI